MVLPYFVWFGPATRGALGSLREFDGRQLQEVTEGDRHIIRLPDPHAALTERIEPRIDSIALSLADARGTEHLRHRLT